MKTFLSIFLCLFISCSNYLFSNDIFKQLTIDNGLAHTDANCVTQDSTGLIWIGTYAGLQNYDGYSLQTFDYYSSQHKIYQAHNRILSMACTRERLWLGTENGLTCFNLDTHCYTPYYIKGDEVKCNLNTTVFEVSITPSGRYLWTKSNNEVIAAEIHNDTIQPLKWNTEEERIFGKSLSNLQFQGETIWATVNRQIAQLKIHNGKITLLNTYKASDLLPKDESIQSIYLIHDFLYIRTRKGCYRVSVINSKLHKATLVYADFHLIDSKIPTYTDGKFIVSKEGTLWCTYSEGIFEVRYPFSEEPSIREYLRNARDGNQSAQKIRNLLIDRYDNLWITTNSWGVFYRTLSKPLFKNISKQDFREMGFSQNEIVSVTGQEDGTIWMLVEYASLFRYDPQTEHLKLIPLPKDNSRTIYYQNAEMSRDQRHLYIGTSYGILIYDTHTQKIVRLTPTSSDDAQKINTSIADLREDEYGRLWIGTWGRGLICVDNPLNAPTITLQLNTQTDPGILSDQISHILINDQSVLLCTTNGLNRLVLTATGKIKALSAYQADANMPATSMSTNYLASIDCENDSIYWIGTIGGGLNKVILHTERNNDYTATCYTTRDGLTNNDCEIVQVDPSGNVWIGGNSIAQLDVLKNKIYTYGFADGLQNNAFKINVSYKSKDGTLYMGGLYGLSYFRPNLFTHSKKSYTLAFTNLSINNQLIVPNMAYNENIVLNKILDKTSKLTLNYLQNNFSISFAALGYELSEQIMYRYRLKDFHKEWRTLRHTNNEVFFSNLPYGSYELEVQLSTDKGYTWHTPCKTLDIIILPPWWLSSWAKATYILLVILIVSIAFWQYNKEQNLKKENEIQKILITQDEEKYQAKMQFFMNASHELKTPLTLILLAAENIAGNNPVEKEHHTILHNARKMLVLITELVDIRKQDLGIATLDIKRIDLSQITRQLFDEMRPWGESKRITITYTTDDETIALDADKNKIGKMIVNLFSNAIKYTDEGGQINISLRKGTMNDIKPCYETIHTEGSITPEQPVCILTVKDTGVGISSESIRLIYERFFQVKGKTQDHLGSGIGLAIVKSTVLQHKGMVIVSSERTVGSEFIVILPIYDNLPKAQLVPEQLLNTETFVNEQYNEFHPEKMQRPETKEIISNKPDLPTLLIVEDNKELQNALKERLSSSYNIHIADNGRMGLETCMSIFPDIIISDVMMPEMDGIEMCRHIKNNFSVAYIPLVMLTAKDNIESQIEGYESGADLYIPKPFTMKLLEVNLSRLLNQREQWFKKNSKDLSLNIQSEMPVENIPEKRNDEPGNEANESQKTFLSAEELLLMTEKLKKIIDENIHNPDLSPEQLSSALGISRTKLYRDIKGIDGQSLSDYVRNTRLEKAACLLANTNRNVQEVMNEVGFVNSSHFTKIFKLKYEVTPSEYKRNCL